MSWQEPITKEKDAYAWWKKFRIATNAVLLFFLALSIVGFLSVRLNLEIAIGDPNKREYFSGLALCLVLAIPWLWNLLFSKLKQNHLQNLKKNRVMQTKKASITLVLSLIGFLLLSNLAFFLDFSLYANNYQKRQKSVQSGAEIEAMPLPK